MEGNARTMRTVGIVMATMPPMSDQPSSVEVDLGRERGRRGRRSLVHGRLIVALCGRLRDCKL
eukprot:6846674-Prymnesium_polylepis.1